MKGLTRSRTVPGSTLTLREMTVQPRYGFPVVPIGVNLSVLVG